MKLSDLGNRDDPTQLRRFDGSSVRIQKLTVGIMITAQNGEGEVRES